MIEHVMKVPKHVLKLLKRVLGHILCAPKDLIHKAHDVGSKLKEE